MENQTYNVLDICKYIILNNKGSRPITECRLQFLLYYLQQYYLKVKNKKLFSENILAINAGPVVLESYYEYQEYKTTEIPKEIIKDDVNILDEDKIILDGMTKSLSKYPTGLFTLKVKNTKGYIDALNNKENHVISDEELIAA